MGTEFALLKALQWIIDQFIRYIIKPILKLFGWRKRRKFLNEIWEPMKDNINKGIEDFYSKEALDEIPSVETSFIKEKTSSLNMFGKNVFLYVKDENVKTQKIDFESQKNTLSVFRSSRTQSIGKHFPSDFRESVETIADREILNEFSEYNLLDHKKTEEQAQYETIVEDLHYDGKIKDIFAKIKNEYGNRKPDTRTRTHIVSIFIDEHRKFLMKDGGILQKLSKRQFSFLRKGLKSWPIPQRINKKPPRRVQDWRIFFLDDDFKILGYATITNMKSGYFSSLKKDNKDVLTIPNMSYSDSIKIFEDWIKGLGGYYRKKGKKASKGKGIPIILIIFKDYFGQNEIELSFDMDKNTGYQFINIKQSRSLAKEYDAI